MGAPESGMQAVDQPAAAELLGGFKRIDAAERRRHEGVLNYWLSIRGDKEFPPLHDLDPLELSDAAPSSLLLELISGGHDAEIRHCGEALKAHVDVDKIIDAAHPSLLSSIAKKLPIVAISRDFLAFEDEYSTKEGKTRCWVTLLPLSAGGAWVDYVYGLVSISTEAVPGAEPAKKTAKKVEAPEPAPVEVEQPEAVEDAIADQDEVRPTEAEVGEAEPVEAEEAEAAIEAGEPEAAVEAEEAEPATEVEEPEVAIEEPEPPVAETLEESKPGAEFADAEEAEAVLEEVAAPTEEIAQAPAEEIAQVPAEEIAEAESEGEPAEPAPKSAPGFSKLLDSLAGLTGFYGSHGVKAEPVMPPLEAAPAPPVSHEEAPVAQDEALPDEIAEEVGLPEANPEQPVAEAEPVAAELPVAAAADEEPAAKPSNQPAPAPEGSLQSKLTEVRAKADEARLARQRATAVLYEGLSAAYDFAIDAEDAPEEYLRLVEAQGLKIQLRSPMKPVVKLAFADTCDDATIKQLEAMLAWALKEELPRGTLLERLEAEGGIAEVLKAA